VISSGFPVLQKNFSVLANLEADPSAVITEHPLPNVALPLAEMEKEIAFVQIFTCHAFLPS
jgi:hypothetical protein